MRDVHKPGRPSKPVRVADVRTLECPNGGTHLIRCDVDQVWRCEGCGVTWSELDTAARQSTKPAPDAATCSCGAHLVSDRRWQEAAPEVRKQWRTEGKAPKKSGMCDRCESRGRRAP